MPLPASPMVPCVSPRSKNADTSRRRCSTLTSFRDRGLNTAPSAVIDLRHDAFAESFSQIPRSQTSLQTGRAERS